MTSGVAGPWGRVVVLRCRVQLTVEEWIKWGTTPGQDNTLFSWVTHVADMFRPDPMSSFLEAKLDPGAKRRSLVSSTKLTEQEIDRLQVRPAIGRVCCEASA